MSSESIGIHPERRFHSTNFQSDAKGLDLSQVPTVWQQRRNLSKYSISFVPGNFIVPFRLISWERKVFLLIKETLLIEHLQTRLDYNLPPAVTPVTIFCYFHSWSLHHQTWFQPLSLVSFSSRRGQYTLWSPGSLTLNGHQFPAAWQNTQIFCGTRARKCRAFLSWTLTAMQYTAMWYFCQIVPNPFQQVLIFLYLLTKQWCLLKRWTPEDLSICLHLLIIFFRLNSFTASRKPSSGKRQAVFLYDH